MGLLCGNIGWEGGGNFEARCGKVSFLEEKVNTRKGKELGRGGQRTGARVRINNHSVYDGLC